MEPGGLADQNPNVAEKTLRGGPAMHWSAAGVGEWVQCDLGREVNLYSLEVAFVTTVFDALGSKFRTPNGDGWCNEGKHKNRLRERFSSYIEKFTVVVIAA